MDIELSEEQLECIEWFKKGWNLKVTALAGSGKSTLALCAIENIEQSKKVLLISYNRKLVDNTNEKLQQMGRSFYNRVFVTTYHGLLGSLASKVVENEVVFDNTMATLDFASKKHTWRFADFDILMVDEVQDMRPGFLRLLKMMILDVCHRPEQLQLFGVGDTMQLLYAFYAVNPADARFLTLFHILFARPSLRGWKECTLSISYRMTSPMAKLLNNLIPSRLTIPRPKKLPITLPITLPILNPNPNQNEEEGDEPCVTWIIADLYKDSASIIAPIAARERGKLLVLCNSLNERSPAVGIVDALVEQNIPVHVSRSGMLSEGSNSNQHQSVTKNKVCFNTKHGSKGCEQEVVVALINANLIDGEIENPDYVALTRAKRKLYIIQNFRKITQIELDQFMRTHDFQQRDLRIIVMRELKMGGNNDPSMSYSKKTKGDDVEAEVEEEEAENKNGKKTQTVFSAQSLFSFIDVAHLQVLLNSIQVSVVQAPIVDVVMMSDEECAKLRFSMLQGYFHNMNVTFDQGQTYFNMTTICGIALTLALEFATTSMVPTLANRLLMRCSSRSEDKYIFMKNQMQYAIASLMHQDHESENEVDKEQVLFKKFKIFAQMATLIDAFYGYGEKLMSIKNYDFIDNAGIYERFRALSSSLTKIITKHNISTKALVWHREEIGRFKFDDKSIRIMAKPTVSSKCGLIVIDILHSPQINDDDHLTGITAAQIIGNQHTTAYQINIGDGAIHHVTLLLVKQPGKTDLLPTEVKEAMMNGVVDMDDIATIQESVQTPIAPSESLDFITQAITFKLYEEKPSEDAEFIRANT